MKLLAKAKSLLHKQPRFRHYSPEEKELCLAWMAGEISLRQVQHALGGKVTGQAYIFLALCSRQIFHDNGEKK